ncbi:peptidase inhibitor family I36 protein [Streptomyces sp. NPDC051162]|uniref:peptidase inhibitor family I36 protein n=1 Tax=unclassified Streptomyces TaxID=2593676 RepID=UPI00344A0AB3
MRTIRFAALAVGAAAGLALVSAPAATATAATPGRPGPCGAGQLCLWSKSDYRGERTTSELSTIDIESCVTLPANAGAASFVNRTGRPVTTYQSATCAETGEFATYPSGSWVPESPYAVRAYKVWES